MSSVSVQSWKGRNWGRGYLGVDSESLRRARFGEGDLYGRHEELEYIVRFNTLPCVSVPHCAPMN